MLPGRRRDIRLVLESTIKRAVTLVLPQWNGIICLDRAIGRPDKEALLRLVVHNEIHWDVPCVGALGDETQADGRPGPHRDDQVALGRILGRGLHVNESGLSVRVLRFKQGRSSKGNGGYRVRQSDGGSVQRPQMNVCNSLARERGFS